jgi:hypothetical protein
MTDASLPGYSQYEGSYQCGATQTSAYSTQNTPAGTSGDPDVGQVSVGELFSKVTNDLSTLVRQEIELAKAEVTTEVKKAGKGAGMLGGAGYAGHFTVLFLSFALWWALAGAMDHIGWAALIVAVLWGAVAAVLAINGRAKLRSVRPKPERTIETVREVPGALKP